MERIKLLHTADIHIGLELVREFQQIVDGPNCDLLLS